jgi:5'/3'-nucleotidase SurE
MRRTILLALLLLTLPLSAAWPKRVLLTNDNGIDDPKLHALARAFAAVAETWVIAPSTDRSGGTNYMPATRSGTYRLTPRDLGENIHAFAVDGFPADCVVFALAGPMREARPDLVVSGINGGANLADDWLGSGTIGAARTAAYLGIPAIAVSGLDADEGALVQKAAQWVVSLARSSAVRRLRPPHYLTVSLPFETKSDANEVVVVPRARGLMDAVATKISEHEWRLTLRAGKPPTGEHDVQAVGKGQIAIVVMRADESSGLTLKGLPPWPSLPSTQR